VTEILARIQALPADWPTAGSLRPAVLARLTHHASARAVSRSAETGTGKSTLLLSHLSRRHSVFALDDTGAGDSLASVRSSPLLAPDGVEFVVGPSQRTLPAYRFEGPLDLVLIDGAHAFPFPHLDYYFLYPHLAPGGVLVLDDVHVRSVDDVFRFLRSDEMFDLLEVVHTTAFFRRTAHATFDPVADGWWLQRYNRSVLPLPGGLSWSRTLKTLARRLSGRRTGIT